MSKEIFAVDKDGLAKILARRGGPAYAVIELLQNGLDEDCTEVRIALTPIAGTRRYLLTVEDDSPEGFHNLSHAWTLFAENTRKKTDPSTRGRFNLGEKLVIAICSRATISTTKGTVEFSDAGRRHLRAKRERGSVFEGEMKMTREEAAQVEQVLRTVIPPVDQRVYFNDEQLRVPTSVRAFEVTLPTEIADDEGYLLPTRRRTKVSLYSPLGETAILYELGLPVVEIPDRYSVDVAQKVPLNTDRDNVTPAYMRELRTAVLNNAHDLIEGDASAEVWIDHALEDPHVSDDAVVHMLTERYGEKRVIFDPSDPEANKLATSEGYSVIAGRSFNKQQWGNIKRAAAAFPAGQVTPSPKPYTDDPDAPVRKLLPEKDWTDGMHRIADLTVALAHELLKVQLRVLIVNDHDALNFSATYGRQGGDAAVFEYNMRTLGRRFFERAPDDESLLALILHEFGHQTSGDHLAAEYHRALCNLGARLARLIRREPNFFERFEAPTPVMQ